MLQRIFFVNCNLGLNIKINWFLLVKDRANLIFTQTMINVLKINEAYHHKVLDKIFIFIWILILVWLCRWWMDNQSHVTACYSTRPAFDNPVIGIRCCVKVLLSSPFQQSWGDLNKKILSYPRWDSHYNEKIVMKLPLYDGDLNSWKDGLHATTGSCVLLLSWSKLIYPWTKWPSFHRRHIQMHFMNENLHWFR